ncbi:hypothetical protein GCM10017714_09700 [Curtobacterium pusillum]|uniref:Uncharacterized protein n=1 Tax=Curtobacterium pusillum TaxID=69373 RepID=A0ABX2M4F9_9MICO|nr:hypothetical protein [Curtobacterium pusillum]NUU12766.1 hypothetical protein [Curtobacterium pusillum]GLK30232.1 hypothetical protein GCM10017610_05170 [Curtobacterium pusillum]
MEAELAAQNEVAALTMRTLGEGWASCHDVFVEVGNTKQLNGILSTFDGQSARRPAPAIELYGAWSRLREVMAGPDRGAWLTGHLKVSSDGRYSMDFEWDERPVWPSSVGTGGRVQRGRDVERSALLTDLLRYPRIPEMTPRWLEELQLLPAPEFQDAEWPSAMRKMQENSDWMIVADGVKRLLGDAILDDELDLLEDDEVADGLLQDVLNQVDAGRFRSMVSVVPIHAPDRDHVWEGINPSVNAGQALLEHPQISPLVDEFRDGLEGLVRFERSAVRAPAANGPAES